MTFYEKEMRRRLWHQLCVADLRTSLDHGSPPLVLSGSYDTPSPLNIEDTDLLTNSFDLPRERVGITSMTFSLLSQRCTEATKLLSYSTKSSNDQDLLKTGHARAQPQEIAEKFSAMVAHDIVSYCDTTVPLHQYCSSVALELASLCALSARRPLFGDVDVPPADHISSDYTLALALDVLWRESEYRQAPQSSGWQWYFWAQWHTVGVALSEICHQSNAGEFCGRIPSAFLQLVAVPFYKRVITREEMLIRKRSDLPLPAWTIIETAFYRQAQIVAGNGRVEGWRRVKRLMTTAQSARQERLDAQRCEGAVDPLYIWSPYPVDNVEDWTGPWLDYAVG